MVDDILSPFHPSKNHVRQLARVLASAFREYPSYQATIPSETRRARLAVLFEVITTYAIRYGIVLAPSETLEGVLLALPWERGGISSGRMLRCGALRIPFALGFNFIRRQDIINRVQEEMHAALAPPVHTYLWALAVDPSLQGKGIGGKLVRILLSMLADQGRPCYLETVKPENVKIYAHLGFRIVGTHEFTSLGFTTTSMLWDG